MDERGGSVRLLQMKRLNAIHWIMFK